MLVKYINYFIFVTFILITTSLFIIKDRVIGLNYQLNEVKNQIVAEQDQIYLLKAEVAYLTSPNMLKKIVANNLLMENVKVSQMGSDPTMINSHKLDTTNELKQSHHANIVKWRYKKNPIKDIHAASLRKK